MLESSGQKLEDKPGPGWAAAGWARLLPPALRGIHPRPELPHGGAIPSCKGNVPSAQLLSWLTRHSEETCALSMGSITRVSPTSISALGPSAGALSLQRRFPFPLP